MENNLVLSKGSESRFSLFSDSALVKQSLDKRFSGKYENAQFHPLVKRRLWDGVIHHIDWKSGTMPIGLFPRLYNYVTKQTDWDVTVDPTIWAHKELMSKDQVRSFIEQLPLPAHITSIDDFQVESVWRAVNNMKIIIEAATSSGKSLMIYSIIKIVNKKTLVIVPSISLVDQMYQDFISYGANPDHIAKVYAGQDKTPDSPIVVSTWQSLYGRDPSIFEHYEVFVGDEAHTVDTKSLHQISNDLVNAAWRIGTSGTLPDDEVKKTSIIGIFGPVYRAVTARELIDAGRATEPDISIHVLKHNKTLNKGSRYNYPSEIDILLHSAERHKYILDLIDKSTESGNVVVFFRFAEKQGWRLRDDLIAKYGKDRIRYIDKSVKGSVRNDIRLETETRSDLILVVTFKTFATGNNARNLHVLIFAHPMQAKDKILQAIGRGLRLHDSKDRIIIHDIADSLYKSKNTRNHGFTHAMARISYYEDQKFNYTVNEIDISQVSNDRKVRSDTQKIESNPVDISF